MTVTSTSSATVGSEAPHPQPIAHPERTETSAARRPRLDVVLALIMAVLAALQSFLGRHRLNPDGVSYLDIADLYVAGEWAAAVNPYWSPLYSWLLTGPVVLARTGVASELLLVHITNFCISLVALAAFVFMLRALLAFRQTVWPAGEQRGHVVPDWLITVVAFCLFARYVLSGIPLWLVTPDLLAAALMFVASGLLARHLTDPDRTRSRAILLGTTLGAAYLAKTAMFFVAPAFVVALLVSGPAMAVRWRSASFALVAFLAISLPFAAMVSLRVGHLSIGEAGRINYGWVVNARTDGSPYRTEPSAVAGEGARRIHQNPAVFSFPAAATGTFPAWHDPVRWLASVDVQPQARRQVDAVRRNAGIYVRMLTVPLIALALLLIIGRLAVPRRELLLGYGSLALPALVGLALYSLVTVEVRYVAGFITVLLIVMMTALRSTQRGVWGVRGVVMGLALVTGYVGVKTSVEGARADLEQPTMIAAAIQRVVPLQDREVAVIKPQSDARWARIAGARIRTVVQESTVPQLWSLPAAERHQVMVRIGATGAVALVARDVPEHIRPEGWRVVEGTPHHVLDLRTISHGTATAAR